VKKGPGQSPIDVSQAEKRCANLRPS
jgi:hypothetical protein